MFDSEVKFDSQLKEDLKRDVSAAKQRASDMIDMRKHLEKRWENAVVSQTRSYNKKHMNRFFKVGDKIYLNAKNIRFIRSSKKLNYKYYDLYVIEKLVDKQTYKFKLSQNMSKMHNMFHVFLLKLFKRENRDDDELSSVELDEENQWEVRKVLNSKIHYEKLYYYVTWLSYLDTDNQWLSVSELQNARELMKDFHKRCSTKFNSDTVSAKRRRRN